MSVNRIESIIGFDKNREDKRLQSFQVEVKKLRNTLPFPHLVAVVGQGHLFFPLCGLPLPTCVGSLSPSLLGLGTITQKRINCSRVSNSAPGSLN